MKFKRILCIGLSALLAGAGLTLSGCKDGDGEAFFEEDLTNPLAGASLGGSDTLALGETDDAVTLENGKVRLVLNRKTGGIEELANKESCVYLARDASSEPLSVNMFKDGANVKLTKYDGFSYTVSEDTAESKKLSLVWTFSRGFSVNADVALSEGADEVVFRLSVTGNDPADSVYCVEYPVVQNVGNLYSAERDYLLHPFATGYLFNDPVTNFNQEKFKGITQDYGLYPSGWESPMQFYSYFSEGIGGFQFSTRDGGTTIKSFSAVGEGDTLRTSVYHYFDDTNVTAQSFDYDISIGNLIKGTWQESAEKYRAWALTQPWAEKGKLENRTDINREFYEEVVACNFNFPFHRLYGEENQRKLYEMEKKNFGGKLLNIFFADEDNFQVMSREHGDLLLRFEFPDFHPVTAANQNPPEWNSALKLRSGEPAYYNLDGAMQFFECASDVGFMERFAAKEREWYRRDQVNGYYHDVGIAAPHSKQCFNTAHPHGTRLNVIPEYLDQMALAKNIAKENGESLYGQELVFEQMLPYADFYQSRGNAELLSWMECDRIRICLENGSCKKVPCFDYVYSAYGAKRLDGYLYGDELLGESYYYIAAFTALNGGIPEYNYEFVKNADYIDPENQNGEMMAYIGYLGKVKQTYGKNYLVYGDMVKAPKTGAGSNEYDFIQQRYRDGVDGGVQVCDKVVTSAFRHNGKIGIFVCNTTKSALELRFVLDALRDYGISSGNIALVGESGSKQLVSLKDGKANISLSLSARQVVMLEIAS